MTEAHKYTIWPEVVNLNLLNSVARINCDPQLKGKLLLMSYDSHHLVVLYKSIKMGIDNIPTVRGANEMNITYTTA